MENKQDKFEVSYAVVTRGTEFSTVVLLNLLPILQQKELALKLGGCMLTLYSLVLVAYYTYSMKALTRKAEMPRAGNDFP